MTSFFQASDFVDSLYEIIAFLLLIEVGVGFKEIQQRLELQTTTMNIYAHMTVKWKKASNSLANC